MAYSHSYSHGYSQTLSRYPLRSFRAGAISAALFFGSLCVATSSAKAAGFDVYGGSEGTQTLHHCGWIPTQHVVYTNVSRNVVIIQTKLTHMGYYRGAIDGMNTPLTKAAVTAFQRDYGLTVDGIVASETATAIGYVGNNASWVRSCHRAYDHSNSRI
jgi:hypothetical protein